MHHGPVVLLDWDMPPIAFAAFTLGKTSVSPRAPSATTSLATRCALAASLHLNLCAG
jgi:hypothetical protein